MTEQERLAQRIEVIVRPSNNYGGAPAGTRLVMTRAEYEASSRCLQEVTGPPAPAPRTARVAIPAHAAKLFGFPIGRRQEGPLVYEVTRLPPDGKPPLPSRQELEARAQEGPPLRAERVLDAPQVQELLNEAREHVRAEEVRIRQAAEAYVRERAEAMEREHHAEIERLTARRVDELKDAHGLLAAARQEIAALQAEVVKLRAEPAPPAPPVRPAPAPGRRG